MVGDFIQNQFAAEVRVFGTKKHRYRGRAGLLGTRRGALASLSRVAAILAVILVPLILILVVLLPLLSILERKTKTPLVWLKPSFFCTTLWF